MYILKTAARFRSIIWCNNMGVLNTLRLLVGMGLICGGYGSVRVEVLDRDAVYYRYVEFVVGAHPGTLVTFKLNFGSCAPNVLPVDALRSSTTWEFVHGNVSSNVVMEYLYYSGQKQLVRGEFVLDSSGGTTGVLNTCALELMFCYSHNYEFREFVMGEKCPLSATHMYKKAVYTGINATLEGNHPVELYEHYSKDDKACGPDVVVDFATVFSVGVPCDAQSSVDIETYPLNIEYDHKQQTLTVYHATRELDNTTGVVIIVVLVLFLSTWLFWTRHLHVLIRFSITREQTEGNPVDFEKTLRKAIRHETLVQSIKGYIFKYKDELYPFVGEEFEPEMIINKGLAEVAATNRFMAWDSIAKFSVIVVDIVVLVGMSTA